MITIRNRGKEKIILCMELKEPQSGSKCWDQQFPSKELPSAGVSWFLQHRSVRATPGEESAPLPLSLRGTQTGVALCKSNTHSFVTTLLTVKLPKFPSLEVNQTQKYSSANQKELLQANGVFLPIQRQMKEFFPENPPFNMKKNNP